MGRVGAFLQVERQGHRQRPTQAAVEDFDDIVLPLSLEEQRQQASRCMNCGVAFCQSGIVVDGSGRTVGCPLHNLIPETNDLLYRGRIDDALGRLVLTNPFPEFTGRVCPAPCETACNLGQHKEPVTINDNERALSDLLWERGVAPLPGPGDDAPVASVVGSGPAGLAVAWELARRGWRVRIFERADRPGGLLMYGIPSMKLPKDLVMRRIDLMRRSGVEVNCGVDATACADDLVATSDAVVLAAGAGVPRDVALPGRTLDGIHFAVDYLTEVTAALLDGRPCAIDAAGKDVVVLGGGDTGTDCVACAVRQGARSVTQVIRAPQPPATVDGPATWPAERPSPAPGYGQREAAERWGRDPRRFATDTVAFEGDDEGAVAAVLVRDRFAPGDDAEREEALPARLVLIAKGFSGADESICDAFKVKAPPAVDGSHYLGDALRNPGRAEGASAPCAIFAAGDGRTGSSLVVSAIADGLACAEEMVAHRAGR